MFRLNSGVVKKPTKILVVAGGALLLGGGSVLSYLQARPAEPLSDLTLANIEAFSKVLDGPSMLGCKERKNSTCYVFDGDGDLVDRRKNEYPGD